MVILCSMLTSIHGICYIALPVYSIYLTCSLVAEFSKMKDELPESFKKGLESAEKEEAQKTTPTSDKEATPPQKTSPREEATPTEEKVFVQFSF